MKLLICIFPVWSDNLGIYIYKTVIKCLKPTKNATASGGSMKIHSPSLTAKMNLKMFDKAGRTTSYGKKS